MNRIRQHIIYPAKPPAHLQKTVGTVKRRLEARDWTPSDDDYLRSKHGRMLVKDIASVLGRTESAVFGRAHRFGLKIRNIKSTGIHPQHSSYPQIA